VAKRSGSRRSIRDRVRRRAAGRCEYCRLPEAFATYPHHTEHVIPKKHRGRTLFSNLALGCAACSFAKGANVAGLDPVTKHLTRLFHPRLDEWNDHFAWKGPMLIGTSPIGRTTVYVLNMNLPERVELRNLMIRLGEPL
jgi:5-methylcytosine-specific restriction endonuclease McrA